VDHDRERLCVDVVCTRLIRKSVMLRTKTSSAPVTTPGGGKGNVTNRNC